MDYVPRFSLQIVIEACKKQTEMIHFAILPVRNYALKNAKCEKAVKAVKAASNKRIALFQTTNSNDMSQCLPSQCAHVFLFLLSFFSFCILICSLTLIAVLLTANQSALVRSR